MIDLVTTRMNTKYEIKICGKICVSLDTFILAKDVSVANFYIFVKPRVLIMQYQHDSAIKSYFKQVIKSIPGFLRIFELTNTSNCHYLKLPAYVASRSAGTFRHKDSFIP